MSDPALRRGGEHDNDDADAWLADARADEVAAERRRQRARRLVAADEADLASTAQALAEAAERVTVVTAAGSRPGRIAFVGSDFLTIGDDNAADVLVPFAAVVAIRTHNPAKPAATAGDRLTLAAALSDMAGDRPRVHVSTAAGPVTGALRSVGSDMIMILGDGPNGGHTHVAISAIVEVALLDRT